MLYLNYSVIPFPVKCGAVFFYNGRKTGLPVTNVPPASVVGHPMRSVPHRLGSRPFSGGALASRQSSLKGLSKTGVMRLALRLLEAVDAKVQMGHKLVIEDGQTSQQSELVIL